MIHMIQFSATIKHDKGSFKIHTVATSEEVAKQMIMKAEGCPESAIIKIKTKKNG